jgi:hypothetical protein
MPVLTSIEGRTRPAQIRNDVVDILQRALDEAKAGKITAVSLAILCADGDVETIASPSDHLYKMIGAVSQLQFNMLSAQRER